MMAARLTRRFCQAALSPGELDKMRRTIQKYAKYHVNPDEFTVTPSRSVPESIVRPDWLHPDGLQKYSHYDSLLLRTDKEEIESRIN